MGLAPEKVLLKWMNYHLKKAGYEKPVTNFSSDLKVAYKFLNFHALDICILILHPLFDFMFPSLRVNKMEVKIITFFSEVLPFF